MHKVKLVKHVTVDILTIKMSENHGQVMVVSSMIPRTAGFHSLCTRNPMISVIIWYKPRDYASTRRPSPTNVNTREQTKYESDTDKSKRTIAATSLIR